MVKIPFIEEIRNQQKEKRLKILLDKYRNGNLKIFIIGAGALANFVAIGLSNLKLGKIIIIDKDVIEETNLNRQVLYFDAVGQQKASALRRKLNDLDAGNKYFSRIKYFDYESRASFGWFVKKPDLLIDCVDNFETRSLLNKFAMKYKIPLISGGTSPLAGQVVMYVPGYTSCLNCELNIDKLAAKRVRERQGCTEVPEGSVVTTNQIIGGLMVGEIYRLLNGMTSSPGTIKYISSDEDRIGFIESRKPCECHIKNKIRIPKMRKTSSAPPVTRTIWEEIKSLFVKEV